MQIVITLTDALLIVVGLGVVQFLLSVWIKSRLESSIRSEYDKLLEDYRFDLRSREQAAKTAEYIALARDLKTTTSDGDYRRANQLAWELALWLPDDLYRKLGMALSAPSSDNNVLSVLVEIRKLLLKHPGTLNDNEVIHHAPNVGAIRSLGNRQEP
jgi:hypothetical protein